MTETRRQYRERLAQVSFNAERPITGLRVYTSDEQERHAAIAEDVAAQVLRDMQAWLYGLGGHASAYQVHLFARERGIDIGERS